MEGCKEECRGRQHGRERLGGDEIKPFFLASKYPWLSSVKVPWKMHDRMTQLSFWSRFRSKKKYTTRPLLDSIPTRKIDSIPRSFRSAHLDISLSKILFRPPISLYDSRWFPGLDLSRGKQVFRWADNDFFSRKKRKKLMQKGSAGTKGGGGEKTGENRDGGAYARSKSKGKTELRHARHPNVTRYIRNERENEYECWDH